MKKISSFLILILLFMILPNGGMFFATAIETDNKAYLISQNYQQAAESYNIANQEIKTDSRPVSEATKSLMDGQSVQPICNETGQVNRTYTTNSLALSQNSSLFVYVFFSSQNVYDLTINLLDDYGNFAQWTVLSSALKLEILENSNSSNLMFGWQLLELPIACAQVTGSLQNVNKIQFIYASNSGQTLSDSAKFVFYAPYIANKMHEQITFSDKQNFYNFSMNYGTKIDSLFVGDEFVIQSWKDLFDFCMLGDVNFLENPTSTYRFVFEVIDYNNKVQSADMFTNTSFSAQFDSVGTYTFRVTLYDAMGNKLINYPDKQIYVDEFVALFLIDDISKIEMGDTISVKWQVGTAVKQYLQPTVTSSDADVAEAYIDGESLIIKAKKSGETTITINICASREGLQEQNYSYSYAIKVTQSSQNSIFWLIVGSIGLIIGAVVVYIIMVKRRLIKGKYPKY